MSFCFQEGEEYSQDDATKGYKVVPADGFPFEDCGHYDGED